MAARSDHNQYTPESLQAVITASASWSDVLDHFGLAYTGSARTYLKRKAAEWDLDVSHLRPRRTRSESVAHRLTPEEVFVYGNPKEKTERLRRLMIEVGIEYCCLECGMGPVWNGHPITLQVDHIDGDRRNNRLVNLRFLCPNCHSQTETWGRVPGTVPTSLVCDCGASKTSGALRCRKCATKPGNKKHFNDYPSLEEIEATVLSTGSIAAAAREIGVSRLALSKHLHARRAATT